MLALTSKKLVSTVENAEKLVNPASFVPLDNASYPAYQGKQNVLVNA